MVINTNIAALTSAQNLNQAGSLLNASLARLSSGSKIVSASDDPAGLAESIALTAQIGQTNAANANVGNAVAFAQSQDGYLQQMGSALSQMATLAVEAQDVTKTDSERSDYEKEFSTLASFISDASSKDFNGVSLFGGTALGVTTDSQGGTFQMQGVTANYLAGSTTTTSTSTVGYAATTTLGQISSAFNSETSGETVEVGSGGPLFDATMSQNSTINDLVNFLNSTGGDSSASYDASTGQLSITAAPGFVVLDYGSLSSELGLNFSTTYGPGNLHGLDDRGFGATSPITTTTTLTHSVTTTTTSPATPVDISTTLGAAAALTAVSAAITQLATDRASVGANLERLNYTSTELGVLGNNLSAANSQITDVDVAQESTNYAKEQILVQSATSMLAQANAAPQSVLKLLQ